MAHNKSKKIGIIGITVIILSFIIVKSLYNKKYEIVPAFCKECIPDTETFPMVDFRVVDQYPVIPEAKSIHPDSFHPLLTLAPYLRALDNRAMLGIISKKVDGTALNELIDWIERSGYLIKRNNMVLLEYSFPIDNVPSPFISSMVQAGLVYLSSVSYVLTGRKKDIELAKGALHSFEVDYQKGGVLVIDKELGGKPWYLEYANPTMESEQLLFVLNGFLYALHTLAKTLGLNLTDELPQLSLIYQNGLKALKAAISTYELPWGWSMYDRTGENRATAGYHAYQSILVKEIALREDDPQIAALADRWISFYTSKLPYLKIMSSSPNDELSFLIHFKGIYPHPYLSEESRTTFLYELNSDGQKAAQAMTTNGFHSPAGTIHFSQNVEVAQIPSKAKKIQVWWENDWLGLPNVYKPFTIDDHAQQNKTNQFLGKWLNPNDPNTAAKELEGIQTNITNIFYFRISDTNIYQSWLNNPVRYIRLKTGFIPSRQRLSISQDQIIVGFRGKYDGPGPGKGWHRIKIVPPEDLSGYKANRVLIKLKKLNLNPSIYPYLELPLLVSEASGIIIAAVFSDGSRISRNFLLNSSRSEIQKVIINWEGFPKYENKPIHTLDIRIILPEKGESTNLAFCTPTLVSGVEGFISILDFIEEENGIFRTELNHNTRLGVPAAYFRMLK